MGMFLVIVGFLVNAVCGVVVLVQAFKTSVGWGLAVMFLPFAGLFFVLNHWEQTKKPFLGGLGGTAVMVLGIFMSASTTPSGNAGENVAERRTAQPQATEQPRATYASAASAPAVPYDPPRNAYVPSYNPPPQPAPAVVTDTRAAEDEWTRKPVYEQVYVDRATNLFYAEKCRKRPENVYRIPRSVAVMQGMSEAKCR
jgi:hypothetical protein